MRGALVLFAWLACVAPAAAGEFGWVPKEHQLLAPDPQATSAKYLVMVVPSTNQVGTYSRVLEVERFPADREFSVTWEYQGGRSGIDTITLTVMHPDGRVTSVGPTTIGSTRRATFKLTLPAGRYALVPNRNVGGPTATQLMEQIVVGAPPPTGAYWACRTRFEITFGHVGTTPCAKLDVTEWPPKIPTVRMTLPPGLPPFPSEWLKTEDFAKVAYVYDLHGYATKRHLVTLPNPTETTAFGWFPTYFHSSMDGRRIPLTAGDAPIARLGHVAKAIVHPQGRGFYLLEVQGRLGLMETSGRYTTFAGYEVTDPAVPYYSELTVSSSADKAYASERVRDVGTCEDGATPGMRRGGGFSAWPSAPPHDKGLHQFIIADSFKHRLLYVDHRPSHSATDPEGPGTGVPAIVRQIAGTYGQITRPCFDHPWDVEMDHFRPVSPTVKWIYWTVRGGQPSMTDPAGTPYDPGIGQICRMRIDLTNGSPVGEPEVFLESGYTQASEGAITQQAGGEYSSDGWLKVQKAYPTRSDSGAPGFILPNAIGFDSTGMLWFVEQCANRMRMVEIETRTVTTRVGPDTLDDAARRKLGKPRTCYEITAQMDTEGVIGPKDTLYGGTYAVQSDFAVHPNGAQRRIIPWTGLTPMPGNLGPGPMRHTVSGLDSNYMWVYAPGNAALPCLFVAHQGVVGSFLVCRMVAGQSTFDRARIEAGYTAWRNAHGGKPAPAVLCSRGGFNAVPAVCFPQLGTMPEAEALAYLKTVYGKSDQQAADIRYTAVQAMRYKAVSGGVAVPPPTVSWGATVQWQTQGATDCAPHGTSGSAPVAVPGSFSVSCTGPGGTTDSGVTLTTPPATRRERLRR